MAKAKEPDPFEDLISQAEAARLRGVSRASISELIKRGRLNAVTVADKVLVRRSEVVNFKELKRGPKIEGLTDKADEFRAGALKNRADEYPREDSGKGKRPRKGKGAGSEALRRKRG